MGLKQKIKKLPALYNVLLSFLNKVDYFNWRFNRKFPSYSITPSWQKRIDIVKADPDNQKIPRIPLAGKVFSDHQLLHNGLKITLGSYYDYGNAHLLIENKGVHEPQEEYAFSEVLPFIHQHRIVARSMRLVHRCAGEARHHGPKYHPKPFSPSRFHLPNQKVPASQVWVHVRQVMP